MNHMKAIFLLFILLFSYCSNATFKKATDFYDNKQYQQAFNEFYKLAKIGHKPSQFNLGVMYLEGTGTEQDIQKAYAWVKLSDENKDQEKQFIEEIKGYLKTDDALAESEEIFVLLRSQYGSEAILETYQPVLSHENLADKNVARAIKTSDPGYPINAKYKGVEGWVLLNFNLSPSGIPTDIRLLDEFPEKKYFSNPVLKAVRTWRFDNDGAKLSKVYAYKFEFKLGDGKYERLIKLKEKAIQGDAASQYLYGRYGSFDKDVNNNFNSTLWYFEAARNGVINAQHEVGESLLKGKGCKADMDKAVSWFTIAAANGYAPSTYELSKLSLEAGNSEQGLSLMTQALEASDNKLAYEILNYIYESKFVGVDPDLMLAKLDMLMGTKIKKPAHIYNLYSRAYELKQDYAKAAEYQHKAIDAWHSYGEENIPESLLSNLEELKSKLVRT